MARIITLSVGFPALERIFGEMEKLGLSKNFDRHIDQASLPLVDVIIFGAWWQGASQIAQELHARGKRIWCLWTSPILQSELSVAEIAYYPEIKDLLDNGIIETVLSGSKDVVEVFGEKAHFIEYPLTMRGVPNVVIKNGSAGLFGPMHPRKNILNQILALKGTPYTLHTGPIDGTYLKFAKVIGVKVEPHPWVPADDFYPLIASMEFGLQCSVPGVESFSYTTFDFLQMDRPVFSTVPWLTIGWTGFRHEDIRKAIESRTVHERWYYRRYAEKIMIKHNEQFKAVLESLL